MWGIRRSIRWIIAAAILIAVQAGAVDTPRRVGPLHAYPVLAPPEPTPKEIPAPGDHAARRAVAGQPFIDPGNPAAAQLQRYDEAVAGLPMDANGFPDWMAALRSGKIQPRASLTGTGGSMDVLDLDVIMKNTRDMPWVRFPHRSHTLWLGCNSCHPHPFETRAGAAEIRMADIFRGQYCGMCHDRVAFVTFFSCARCHSVAPAGAPRQGG